MANDCISAIAFSCAFDLRIVRRITTNANRVHRQAKTDERVFPLGEEPDRAGQSTCARHSDRRRDVREVMRAARDHAERGRPCARAGQRCCAGGFRRVNHDTQIDVQSNLCAKSQRDQSNPQPILRRLLHRVGKILEHGQDEDVPSEHRDRRENAGDYWNDERSDVALLGARGCREGDGGHG